MNTICLYLFVVVLSLSQCEYTMTYLYPLRLGDKATEVKMIVDSKEDQSIVFSNSVGNRSQHISWEVHIAIL